MYSHVVLFKARSKDDALAASAALLAMRGQVPSLRHIEVGVDEGGGGRSWSLCLITRFEDEAGYLDYAVHPAHAAVKQQLNTLTTDAAVVDWGAEG